LRVETVVDDGYCLVIRW